MLSVTLCLHSTEVYNKSQKKQQKKHFPWCFFWAMWILHVEDRGLAFREDQLFLKQSTACTEKNLQMEPNAQRHLGRCCDTAVAHLQSKAAGTEEPGLPVLCVLSAFTLCQLCCSPVGWITTGSWTASFILMLFESKYALVKVYSEEW